MKEKVTTFLHLKSLIAHFRCNIYLMYSWNVITLPLLFSNGSQIFKCMKSKVHWIEMQGNSLKN